MSYLGGDWYDCPHCGAEERLRSGETSFRHVCRACGHTTDEHVMDKFGFCRRCNGQHPFVRDPTSHLARPQRPKWKAITMLIVHPQSRREDSRIVMFGDKFAAEVEIHYSGTVGIDMFSNEH